MKGHAYAIRIGNGGWFAGFSGTKKDANGHSFTKTTGDFAKARLLGTAGTVRTYQTRLAERGYPSTAYFLEPILCDIHDRDRQEQQHALANKENPQ